MLKTAGIPNSNLYALMKSLRIRLFLIDIWRALLVFACLGLMSRVYGDRQTVSSPDGTVVVVVDDADGLRYSVTFDGRPVLVDSRLGLDFAGGLSVGRKTAIVGAHSTDHDGSWDNPFGQRRIIPDVYREMTLDLEEHADAPGKFRILVRAYNNGVAFRYEIPDQPGLERYTVTDERTEFAFAKDYPCWRGDFSECAECQYPASRLTQLTQHLGRPHVLPLLVELEGGYAAVAESDLIDWGGMFLSALGPRGDGSLRPGAKAAIAPRKDGCGLVVGTDRRVSPWRVVVLVRNAKELVNCELIPTLATPSQMDDASWIQPGVSAWDVWWTGTNSTQPEYKGLNSRGDTRSHKEYIDFAGEMGFEYQLIDWFWYEPMNHPDADLTKPAAHVDIPQLVAYANDRNVKLLLWIDWHDLDRQGFDKVFSQVVEWGIAGVKIDFMNSDSQETVQWYWKVLESAAKHHLLVDLHGAYKPTGLARTWPNFITQEGVLGNEYFKIRENACTPLHTVTLPFVRGWLGPMDFTPGGFLNRTEAGFRITQPAEVVGTRARQLAQTVVYFSPLLVLCDSPAHYRAQPGLEFFRDLPTVWDETVVLSAEVAEHVVVARRSGEEWYLAGLNGAAPLSIEVNLGFLSDGEWALRVFEDLPESETEPTRIGETTRAVKSGDSITLNMVSAGGYAAILSRSQP